MYCQLFTMRITSIFNFTLSKELNLVQVHASNCQQCICTPYVLTISMCTGYVEFKIEAVKLFSTILQFIFSYRLNQTYQLDPKHQREFGNMFQSTWFNFYQKDQCWFEFVKTNSVLNSVKSRTVDFFVSSTPKHFQNVYEGEI